MQTTLISERFYFARQNSGETLIKKFLKSRQAISGDYFLHKLVNLTFFSLQLTDTINNYIFSGQKRGT